MQANCIAPLVTPTSLAASPIESKNLNKLNKKNTILNTRQSRIKQDDLCTKPS